MSVQSGISDDKQLYHLLNHAFDGWGTYEYFDWKYNSYPNYDTCRDDFVVTKHDEIVAARRVFQRELVLPSGEETCAHIHGGTVVHRDYRGNGFYTSLLEKSIDFSRKKSAPVFTFNRKGKLTTEHHQKEGWNWIVLPVYAKVLSPTNVASQYILDRNISGKVPESVSDIERWLLANTPISKAIAVVADRLYGRHETNDPTETAIPFDYTIKQYEGEYTPKKVLYEMSKYLDKEASSKYHFSRTPEALEHCVSYPNTKVFVARSNGQICGFAVAGVLTNNEFKECRVLEQTWDHPGVTKKLFEKIESYAKQITADVIVTCSKYRPRSDWISLDTEYMMWPRKQSLSLPQSYDQWRITTYDIL